MTATALILNNDNAAWLADCLDGVGEAAIVYHAPGIGVYGDLKKLPTVKQPAGQPRHVRHAAALQDLLNRFRDAQRFAVLEETHSPRLYVREEAAAIVDDFAQWQQSRTLDKSDARPVAVPVCETYPHDCGRADVFIVTSVQQTPGWWETRAEFVVDQLRSAGISACAVAVRSGSVSDVESLIERHQPKLLLNRAMLIPAATVRKLATRNRSIRFATVCHSSYGSMSQGVNWRSDLADSIANARRQKNVYFAHVDERNQLSRLFNSEKFIHLANVVKTPARMRPRQPADTGVASLICVPRDLKNVTTQLLGAALAAKQRPLRLHVSLRGDEPGWLFPLVDSLGLNARFVRWSDWSGHMETLAEEIDVGLQASFTESFNYVGLEHLLCGKPVVGSPALRYLPKEWQADPDDADSIAALIVDHFTQWDMRHQLATRIGAEVAARCNAQFIEQIERMLS